MLRAGLGAEVDEVFQSFDRIPLAAASIAQVHAATFGSGERVVVKVRRPGIETVVAWDLHMVDRLARRLRRSTRWGRGVGAVDLSNGFAGALREELDMRIEAQNMTAVAAAAAVRGVPEQYGSRKRNASLCTANVLVMERLDGRALGIPPDVRMFTDLFRIVAEHGLSVPPEIAGAFRALATIEGTLMQLAPGFDILIQARLFTTAYLAEQLSPAALRKSATDELISLVPMQARLDRRTIGQTSRVCPTREPQRPNRCCIGLVTIAGRDQGEGDLSTAISAKQVSRGRRQAGPARGQSRDCDGSRPLILGKCDGPSLSGWRGSRRGRS